ncbi:MAG: metallophosphoesterase [Bacteroidales bacterium]|nr:metallophosphoesterase [Bacteroidales bacterium]
MKPYILSIVLILATACHSFEPFTFVQMSDTQIGFIDESPAFAHSDSLMKAAVDAANALNPAYVFITGDLVDNPDDPIQDSIYKTRLAQIQAPVYEVLGNHDHRNYGFRFSFQDRGCAFIGIDSNCIKDGATEAEKAQLEWLTSELDAAARCRYTFIFLHCPVVRENLDEKEDYFNFSSAQREQYISLFKEKGVDVVFAGHTHQDYDTTVDGIRFVAAGPVGNALGHGTPGFNVVTVTRDSVSIHYTPTIL